VAAVYMAEIGSCSETPRRNINSMPLALSYNSLSREMEDVVILGVPCNADTGKIH